MFLTLAKIGQFIQAAWRKGDTSLKLLTHGLFFFFYPFISLQKQKYDADSHISMPDMQPDPMLPSGDLEHGVINMWITLSSLSRSSSSESGEAVQVLDEGLEAAMGRMKANEQS